MSTNITSHNQQGGITAGTVSGNNTLPINIQKEKKTPFWKNPWLITIIGGLIVGLIILYLQVNYNG